MREPEHAARRSDSPLGVGTELLCRDHRSGTDHAATPTIPVTSAKIQLYLHELPRITDSGCVSRGKGRKGEGRSQVRVRTSDEGAWGPDKV